MKKGSYKIFLGLLAAAIFFLDFFTKRWIVYHVPLFPYGGISVFENFFGVKFTIVHAINKGAAWGLFDSFPHLLLIVRFILIGGLLAYLVLAKPQKRVEIPLVMCVAAAIGNITDFFLYGHVVDLFYFILWGYSFAIFNVADSILCCSLIFLALTRRAHAPKHA